MYTYLKSILGYIIHNNEVVGIEIIQYNNPVYVNIVILKRSKNKIIIVSKKHEVVSIEEVKNFILPDKPVYLILNLRNILHKTIESTIHVSDEMLIQEVFPNASDKDFYIQKENIATGKIISVIRQDLLNSIINDFTKENITVLGVALGSFDVKYIKPLLPSDSTIHAQTHSYTFNTEQKITHFTRNTEGVFDDIKIGDDMLDSRLIPAYAGAFKSLLQIPPSFHPQLIKDLQEEYFQKKVYQSGSLAALVLVFLILLCSTFLNFIYKEKSNKLSFQLVSQNADFSALDSLKKQVAQQKTFVQQTNISQSSRTSFFADRLAASIPMGLELIQLNIFPMLGNRKDYKENQLVKFQNEIIMAKGVCDNSITYNEWIKKLHTLDWVSTAMHIDYKDINSNLGEFELKITTVSSK
jgi:hypothetical protein